MTKNQKIELLNAAEVIRGHIEFVATTKGIDTARPHYAKLGSIKKVNHSESTIDKDNRALVTTYLARRITQAYIGYIADAQEIVRNHYGLTKAQVEKLERVAASTHNIKQRAERVAGFLQHCASRQGYMGRSAPKIKPEIFNIPNFGSSKIKINPCGAVTEERLIEALSTPGAVYSGLVL